MSYILDTNVVIDYIQGHFPDKETSFVESLLFAYLKNEPAIKRGKCAYDNVTEYEVKIIKWHTLYGTGDYEDPEEIQNDRDVECYYVFYENFNKKGDFSAGGGGFLSIEEAIASVEINTKVKWLN